MRRNRIVFNLFLIGLALSSGFAIAALDLSLLKNMGPMHAPIDYDKTVYSKCILEKANGQSRNYAAEQACKVLAVPNKCRASVSDYGNNEAVNECIDACKKAGWYSKKFGECSF